MVVLSDQETPDKTPEHYVDAEFHAESENHVHSGQFPIIPDIIRDLKCEIVGITIHKLFAGQCPRDNVYNPEALPRCTMSGRI